MQTNIRKIITQLLRWFIQGALFIIPIALSFYVIYAALSWIDGLIIFEDRRGLGFLVVVGFITLIGYLTSIFIAQSFFAWVERVMKKLPLISLIYTSIKDLIGAFVGDKRKFSVPVLIKINEESNLCRIGFITSEDLSEFGLADMIGVYVPHSYNFSGNFYVVKKENVTKINSKVSSADLMKLIVSGGVSGS
jgi:uncharacterized membrane protein